MGESLASDAGPDIDRFGHFAHGLIGGLYHVCNGLSQTAFHPPGLTNTPLVCNRPRPSYLFKYSLSRLHLSQGSDYLPLNDDDAQIEFGFNSPSISPRP